MAIHDPTLVTAANQSFLAGLTAACTLLAALCYLAAAVGVAALPGRRFTPPLAETGAALTNR